MVRDPRDSSCACLPYALKLGIWTILKPPESKKKHWMWRVKFEVVVGCGLAKRNRGTCLLRISFNTYRLRISFTHLFCDNGIVDTKSRHRKCSGTRTCFKKHLYTGVITHGPSVWLSRTRNKWRRSPRHCLHGSCRWGNKAPPHGWGRRDLTQAWIPAHGAAARTRAVAKWQRLLFQVGISINSANSGICWFIQFGKQIDTVSILIVIWILNFFWLLLGISIIFPNAGNFKFHRFDQQIRGFIFLDIRNVTIFCDICLHLSYILRILPISNSSKSTIKLTWMSFFLKFQLSQLFFFSPGFWFFTFFVWFSCIFNISWINSAWHFLSQRGVFGLNLTMGASRLAGPGILRRPGPSRSVRFARHADKRKVVCQYHDHCQRCFSIMLPLDTHQIGVLPTYT